MSVVVTLKIAGDSNRAREFFANSGDRIMPIAEEAKRLGAIHHQFAIGDGFVLVIDEWETADQFMGFFQSQAEIPGIMRDAGATGEPEITIAEKLDTADSF